MKANLEIVNLDTLKQVIHTTKVGVSVVAAWSKDEGTKETKLILVLLYPDGEISPIMEYQKSKLGNAKTFMNLADLDGVELEEIEAIFKAFLEKKDSLPKLTGGEGKCSLTEAYKALCEYVNEYEEPQKVFVKDNYGYILAEYLPTVLDKLNLGYKRLELQKNFKTWDLLQVNNGTRHPYSYKVRDKWFFSFKLQERGEQTC